VPTPGAAQPPLEATLASPTEHEPSQLLVSRRAIGQIVRAAVAGSYGVTGLTDDRPDDDRPDPSYRGET